MEIDPPGGPGGALAGRERSGLGASIALAGSALALLGVSRLAFNAIGLRVFGAAYLGDVNLALSGLTIAAVLVAAIPAVLGPKYVGEFLGRGERERARRLLGGLVLGTAAMGGVAAAAAGAWLLAPMAWLAPYAFLLPVYLLFKATYFACGMPRRYFRSELLSAVAFFAVFGAACMAGSGRLAVLSLLVHPGLFALLALADHRSEMRLRGALREIRDRGRDYTTFSLATLVNAAAGLGSHHLVVVLAGVFLEDRAAVGRLSVLLAALSPLNLLPMAVGTVLLPELAARFGARDEAGLRALVRRAVLALESAALVAVPPLMVFGEHVLVALHLPASAPLLQTWNWLAVSFALSATSSPCGHYLNATRHVQRHAWASGAFFGIGTAIGVVLFPHLGIVAAGAMRFAVDGGASLARMALAEAEARWTGGTGTRLAFLSGLAALGLSFALGVGTPGAGASLVACAVAWGLALGLLAASRRSRWLPVPGEFEK